MKLICDQCGAKYSIADEKVRGKVFKIRCKKCQNVIVVRGTEQPTAEGGQAITASDSPASEPAPAEPEPIWYVVIGREQVGPLTDADLEGRLKSGEVSGESFVWQEGFSDWVQINTVERFSSLAGSAAGAPAPAASNGAGAPAAADGAGLGGDADGFGDHDQSANSEMDDEATQAVSTDSIPGYAEHQAAAAAAAADAPEPREEATAIVHSAAAAQEQAADAGLAAAGVGAAGLASAAGGMAAAGAFGDGGMTLEEGPAAAPFDAGGQLASNMEGSISAGAGNDLMSSAPAEADGGGMFSAFDQPPPEGANGDPAMVGARNENSVLFSLKNLQSLAMGQDSGAGGPVAPSTEGLTDASGLIDVRALAGDMPGSATSGVGDMADDGMPLAPAAPVMIPMVRKRSNTPLILGAVFGGFLILGLSGIVITLLLRDGSGSKKPALGRTAVATAVPSKGKKTDDGSKEEIGAVASKAEDLDAKASEKGKAPKKSAKKDGPKKEAAPAKVAGGSKASSARKAAPKASARKAAPRKAARPTPKSKSGDQDIDDLLGGSAVAAKSRKDSRRASAAKKTPKPSAGKGKLDKRAIQKVVRANGPRISRCATRIPGPPGQKVKIAMRWQIQPNGRVASASVLTAKFKSHSVGRCVLSAVKAMRFPSFDGKPIKIGKYPFNLKK